MTVFNLAQEDQSANQAEAWAHTKASPAISRQQALTLLHKLANDDEFRALFVAKPIDALLQIGVPAEKANSFPVESLISKELVAKSKFKELHARILEQTTTEWLCMIIPTLRIEL